MEVSLQGAVLASVLVVGMHDIRVYPPCNLNSFETSAKKRLSVYDQTLAQSLGTRVSDQYTIIWLQYLAPDFQM